MATWVISYLITEPYPIALPEDVQSLLLRLGVGSTIHINYYSVQSGGDLSRRVPSYQVTVYDTALASLRDCSQT